MAIIAGQVPEPPPAPADVQRRVVVKLRAGLHVPAAPGGPEFARSAGGTWDALTMQFPGVRVTPYFTGLDASAVRRVGERARASGVPSGAERFASYVAIDVPSVDALEPVERGDAAEVGRAVVPAVRPAEVDDFAGREGRLEALLGL